MLLEMLTPMHQPTKIEEEPIDVDALELKLNTDFAESVPHQEEIIHEV